MIPAFKFRLWRGQGQIEKQHRTPIYFGCPGVQQCQWWQRWRWHRAPAAPVSEENVPWLELWNTNVMTQSHYLFCPLHPIIKRRQSLCEVPHPMWGKEAKKEETATNAWRSPTNQVTQDIWLTHQVRRKKSVPLGARLSWGLDLM